MVIRATQSEHTIVAHPPLYLANFYLYAMINDVSNEDDERQMTPLPAGPSVPSKLAHVKRLNREGV
jgi:hypothetical protein